MNQPVSANGREPQRIVTLAAFGACAIGTLLVCFSAVSFVLREGGAGRQEGAAVHDRSFKEAAEDLRLLEGWRVFCESLRDHHSSATCFKLPKKYAAEGAALQRGGARKGRSRCTTDSSDVEDGQHTPGMLDVIVLIDALRPDMLLSPMRFPFFSSLLERRMATIVTPIASAPTVTLPKVKSLLTGRDSTFLDLLLNFAASEIKTSNVVDIAAAQVPGVRDARCLAFLGDDTWTKLFPSSSSLKPHLHEAFVFSNSVFSFDVTDHTEVDENVTASWRSILGLPPEAKAHTSQADARSRYSPHGTERRLDGIIMHYLGLDHVGHTLGPSSETMLQKQLELDDRVLRVLHNALCSAAPEQARLIIVSDHGMMKAGGHGGAAAEETQTVLAVVRCSPPATDKTAAADASGNAPPRLQAMLELQVDAHRHYEGQELVTTRRSTAVPMCAQADVAAVFTTLLQRHQIPPDRPRPIVFLHPIESAGVLPHGMLDFLLDSIEARVDAALSNMWHLVAIARWHSQGESWSGSATQRSSLLRILEGAASDMAPAGEQERVEDKSSLHAEVLHAAAKVQRLLLSEDATAAAELLHPSTKRDDHARMVWLSSIILPGFACVCVVLSVVFLLVRPWRLQDTALCGVTAIYAFAQPLLLISSSFVEEEHLILHGSFALCCAILAATCFRNKQFLWLVTLALLCFRFGGAWTHSGTKWLVFADPPWTFWGGLVGDALVSPQARTALNSITLWQALAGVVASGNHAVEGLLLALLASLPLLWRVVTGQSYLELSFLALILLVLSPISGLPPVIAGAAAGFFFSRCSACFTSSPRAGVVLQGLWLCGAIVLIDAGYSMPGRSILLSDVAFNHLMHFHEVAYEFVHSSAAALGISTAVDAGVVKDALMLWLLGPMLFMWHHAGRLAVLLGLAIGTKVPSSPRCSARGARGKGDVGGPLSAAHLACALLLRHVVALVLAMWVCGAQRGHLFYWTVFLPKVLFQIVDVGFAFVVFCLCGAA